MSDSSRVLFVFTCKFCESHTYPCQIQVEGNFYDEPKLQKRFKCMYPIIEDYSKWELTDKIEVKEDE